MDNIGKTDGDGRDFWIDRFFSWERVSPQWECGYILDEKGKISSTLTPQSLKERSWEISRGLYERGVREGDRVILALPTSHEFLEVFLACWWLGAVPVPLPEISPHHNRQSFYERLFHVLSDSTPKGIVVLEEGKNWFSQIQNSEKGLDLSKWSIWSFSELFKPSGTAVDIGKDIFRRGRSQDSLAFIQYTSGSTGHPKGVMVTHGSLRANCLAMGEACQMSGKDRFLTWVPLYHDMGLIGGFLFPFYWKVPFYLMSPFTFLSSPAIWPKAISDHKITLSSGPNFSYDLCARRVRPELIPELDLSQWRLAFNGSEPINARTLIDFQKTFSPYGFSLKAFYPVYGMAEATLAITFPPPSRDIKTDLINRRVLLQTGRAQRVLETEQKEMFGEEVLAVVGVGKQLPGHRVVIREVAGQRELGEREVGEVCFIGDSVSPGYFHDREKISAKGEETGGSRELRTGDMGYLDKEELYIVDRVKDVIQIAGINYYPTDIERQVGRIPGIREGRVVALEIPNGRIGTNELVMVAQVAPEASHDSLRKLIKEVVYTTYGVIPRDVVLSSKSVIPLTSSGKIRRKYCKELYDKGTLTQG